MKRNGLTASVLLPALLCLLATGCLTAPRRLESSATHTVQAGATTRAEVEKRFGQPFYASKAADGRALALYRFHRYIANTEASDIHRRDHPGDVLHRTLSLLYAPNGTVEAKLADESFTPLRRSRLGWLELGPELDSTEHPVVVHVGEPLSEVIARLGEPMERVLNLAGQTEIRWYYFRDRADYRGQPQARQLTVRKGRDNKVVDYTLTDYNMPQWLWW